jgi:hypothetical protein
VRAPRAGLRSGKFTALMYYEYETAISTVLLAAIGAGFVWLGKHIKGASPNRTRNIFAWPFLGLGMVFLFAAALNLAVNCFGGLALESPRLLMWLRAFFSLF